MFPNDDNETLKECQAKLAHQVQMEIFRVPGEMYLKAGELLQVEDELIKRLRAVFFDHQLINTWRLCDVYLYLAAYHRIKTDPGGQMPLPFEDHSSYSEQISRDWLKHFWELLNAMLKSPDIARSLIKMVVYSEDDIYQADNAFQYVMEYLKENFPLKRKENEQISLPGSSSLGRG